MKKEQGAVYDRRVGALPNISVTVYNQGTQVKPTIYSDNGVTPQANPFQTDSLGRWAFYVANGRYDIEFSGPAISTFKLEDVLIEQSVGGVTDHGALTGLADDDHTQYFLADGTRNAAKIIITDGANHYLQVPQLTTAQRDGLTPVNGMIIYNSTTTQFERYQAGAWAAFGGVTNHAGLTGLGADDHTQYFLADGTRNAAKVIIAGGANHYLQVPSLTTAERDGLSPVNGMIIYNSTTAQFERYQAGAWAAFGGVTDHGGLTGLADDDHTQYLLADGTRNAAKLIITDGANHYLQVPKLTTAERDGLTPVNGMVIYNTTTAQFERYQAGAWAAFGGVTDHGLLTGLGDDDHTQYFLADGTRNAAKLIITDGANHYLQVPQLTTVQRDGLTPVNGMIIYNSTTTQFERYQAGAWAAFGGVTNHAGLTGLGADDHTQYFLADGTRNAAKIIITGGANHYLQVPSLTTTERDGLSPVNGMIIYNSTTAQFERYQAGAWGAFAGGGGGGVGGKGHFSNLVIIPNSTNPDYQTDIDADSIILADASNNLYEALGVNLTVDLTTSGANGLDTGALAVATWYFLWVIYNGSIVAGLLSTSSSAPTMPGGYTYKKLIGAVRNIGMVSQLHMDGADEGTTFTDESGKTWTAYGNANTEQLDPKFGTAAGEFDGTGDWIDTPDHADFTLGSKDFTIEFFVKRGRNGLLERWMGQCDASISATSTSFYIAADASNNLKGGINQGGTGQEAIYAGFSDTAAWHHVALVRKGSSTKIFLDGTAGATLGAVTGWTINDSANKLTIGRTGEYASDYFQGKIDEFSVTVGLAKYWDNFTPPTAAFKNLCQILPFTQIDREIQLSYPHKVGKSVGSTTTASLSLATVVPTIAKRIWGKVLANTGALHWFFHTKTFPTGLAADNNFTLGQIYIAAATAMQWVLEILEETQTLYHQVSANTVDVWVSGFDLKI